MPCGSNDGRPRLANREPAALRGYGPHRDPRRGPDRTGAGRLSGAGQALLSEDDATAMFVTTFHGVLDLATGLFRYANAGHNWPYHFAATPWLQHWRRPAAWR